VSPVEREGSLLASFSADREKGSEAVSPVAIVWPCPLAVDAYAAAGRDVGFPRPACPSCAGPLVSWSGYWRYVREAGRPRVCARRVKSPLSRWNKHPPGKPRTCLRITKITSTIRTGHPHVATRRQQCVTTARSP
jgi:hypothetical protein